MKFTKDLVPIIRREDIDTEATNFLKKYCPEALETPMPLPLEDIAEFKMDLEIDYVNLTPDASILGMMIFTEGVTDIGTQRDGSVVQ